MDFKNQNLTKRILIPVLALSVGVLSNFIFHPSLVGKFYILNPFIQIVVSIGIPIFIGSIITNSFIQPQFKQVFKTIALTLLIFSPILFAISSSLTIFWYGYFRWSLPIRNSIALLVVALAISSLTAYIKIKRLK